MATGMPRETATIYQFPLRGRRAPVEAAPRQPRAEGEVAALRLPKAVAIGGWYHEAAIEAERAAKR